MIREMFRRKAVLTPLLAAVAVMWVSLTAGTSLGAVSTGGLGPAQMFRQVEQAVSPACGCQVNGEEVDAFIGKIEAAPTVADAQALALEQSHLARRALTVAEKLGPLEKVVAPTRDRLDTYERQVAQATTRAEVSAAFNHLIGKDSAQLQEIRREGRCDYTGGEILIIVIGFLLGIIPGIIFLFLLC